MEQIKTIAKTNENQIKINRFIFFRKRHIGETQEIAALALGCSQATISLIERGERKMSAEFIDNLYNNFSLNPSWFVNGIGNEIIDDKLVKNTITVIGDLRAEVASLNRKVQILDANINQTYNMIDVLQKRLDKAKL